MQLIKVDCLSKQCRSRSEIKDNERMKIGDSVLLSLLVYMYSDAIRTTIYASRSNPTPTPTSNDYHSSNDRFNYP